MGTPGTVPFESTLVTLIVDHGGRRRDLAFPTGITLGDALGAVGTGGLTAFAVTGAPMRVNAVLGQDLNSGALVLLRRTGWEDQSSIRPVDHFESIRAANVSAIVSLLATAAGLIVIGSALFFRSLRDQTLAPPGYEWVMAVCVVASFVLALRASHGKPLLEVGVPVVLITAGAFLGTFANPGDPTHQALFTSMLGISIVSLVRWLRCGRASPDAGNVAIDTAILAILIGLLDMMVMELDQPVQLTGAIIFGLCPPILAAIAGFSIRVPSDALLDSSSVIREASAVRKTTAPLDDDFQDVPLLLTVSSARNRLWTMAASLGCVLSAPTMVALSASPGWRGALALAALLGAVSTCLLMPRKSSSRYVRIVPRVAAGLVIVMVVVFGETGLAPLALAAVLVLGGLLFFGASFLVQTEHRFYGFSRVGDIIQSLAVVASLPLSLAAVGVISLVRSGGLG